MSAPLSLGDKLVVFFVPLLLVRAKASAADLDGANGEDAEEECEKPDRSDHLDRDEGKEAHQDTAFDVPCPAAMRSVTWIPKKSATILALDG